MRYYVSLLNVAIANVNLIKRCLFLLLLIISLPYAIPVKIQGLLTNSKGKPIAGAHLTLANGSGLESTSESDGYFGIYGDITTGIKKDCSKPLNARNTYISGHYLYLPKMYAGLNVRVKLFDLYGRIVLKIEQNGSKVALPDDNHMVSGRYFLKAESERRTIAQGLLCVMNGKYSFNGTTLHTDSDRSAITTLATADVSASYVIDTLIVTASGYRTTLIPLTSYQFVVKALAIDSSVAAAFSIPSLLNREQFVALAQSYYQKNYALLSVEEKAELDKYKLFLESSDSTIRFSYANQLMTASTLLEANNQGGYITMCGVSAAAAAVPFDAAITNNFGSFLIGQKDYHKAIQALEYSLSLRKDAPLIRTNLATVYLELDQDSLAEIHLREALRINDSYGYANSGMALLMYKRRDFAQALKYMMKNSQTIMLTELKPLFKEATGQIKIKIPEAPLPPGFVAPSESNPSGSLSRPLTKFVMPPYPKWDSPVSMAKASNLIKIYSDKTFGESMEIASNILNLPDRIKAMNQLERERFIKNSLRYGGAEFGLECLMEYFKDRHDEVDSKYNKKYSEASKKHLKYIEEVMPGITARMKTVCDASEPSEDAGAEATAEYMKKALLCIEGGADLFQEMCKKIKVSNDQYFLEWNCIARDHYNEDKRLCEEFWVMSEQYLNMVYENDLFFENMEKLRRQHVLAKMGLHPLLWGFNNLAQIGLLSFYSCAQEPVPETVEEAPQECTADSSSAPPCPLPSDGVSGSAWIVSAKLSCDDVSITVGQGVKLTFAENFKTRERTYSVGAGVDAKLGFKAGSVTSGELKAELGATFSATVDRNGNLVDLGAGVDAGVGLSMLGHEVGSFASARSTVRAGFSSELVARASAGGYTYFNGTISY